MPLGPDQGDTAAIFAELDDMSGERRCGLSARDRLTSRIAVSSSAREHHAANDGLEGREAEVALEAVDATRRAPCRAACSASLRWRPEPTS
jgi:hypothetical protein